MSSPAPEPPLHAPSRSLPATPLMGAADEGGAASAQARIDELRAARGSAAPTDFSGISLVGGDLSGLDLTGANLAGADLSGANLERATLFGAQLRGTLLTDANLAAAELSGADLSGANLEGAHLEGAGLGHANLTDATLVRATLVNATLTEADLTRADLRSADLRDVRARDTNFTAADLTKARCAGAEFDGSRVTDATLDHTDLRGASLSGLHGFQRASWIGADIRDIDFTGAYMCRRHIRDENFIEEFRRHSRTTRVVYHLWRVTSDCGRSAGRWSLCTALVVCAFAWLYTLVGVDYGAYRTPISPLYFSLVTLTTLGYGDVLPSTTAGQVVAMCEVVCGYVMLGGLLSLFTSKMASRAD